MSKTPVYQQIKATILTKIHSGEWTVGSALPPEITLAKNFNVSRMTVNRALKELTDEKVLERRQGSGTFVAQERFSHTFITVRNIAHDIQSTGKHYHAKVLNQHRLTYNELPPPIQTIFDEGQCLFKVEIIHFGDGKPLQFERRFVDLNLVPAFEHQDFTHINTSDYLISQVPLVRGHYVIEAKTCPLEVANALACDVCTPALRLSRHTYSGDKVVTFVEMWHNGHNFTFSGNLG